MILAAILATGFFTSLLVGWLLLRFEGLHAHLSYDHTASGPQKFHSRPTPRIGSLSVAAGFLVALGVALWSGAIDRALTTGFCLSVLPAFFSGLGEDISKKIGPDIRLWASFLSALVAVYFFDAVVSRSGLAPVDALLAWYPLALVFTVVGIGGVAHAVNIIDGYNGLAAVVTIMMLAALGTVSWIVGDAALAALCVALASGTLGFLRWNFPWGRMFAGDGGAYFWGVSVALVSVLLIGRNPQVSPWFPLAVVIYPVFETLFSVYRRKLKHSAQAGLPDAMHLHQLIYRRLLYARVAGYVASPETRTLRNAATAPFLWCLAAISILPSVFLWNDSGALVALVIGFCLGYVWLYRSIARFTVPRWLRRVGRSVALRILRTQANHAAP